VEFEDGERDNDAPGAVLRSEEVIEDEEEEDDEEEEPDTPTVVPARPFESSLVGLVLIDVSEPIVEGILLVVVNLAALSFSFLSPPTSIDEEDALASVSFFSKRKNGCASNSERGDGREAGFTDKHLMTRSRNADSVLVVDEVSVAADVDELAVPCAALLASSVSPSFPYCSFKRAATYSGL
jgi:hypothetical protein